MSIFKNVTSDDSIANERDSVGGGGVLESGLYPATVKLAYATTAASGAMGLVLHLQTEQGREIRETLWITSGKAKGGKNYYEKDGQKHYLPGYLNATALTLLTVGEELSEVDTETKVVNVYSREAKAEVPTKVEMLMDLLDQPIHVGVIKEIVDKTTQADDGSYVPTGETREQNVIDKFFRASDNRTTSEIRAKSEDAVFVNTWKERWSGKTRDRSTKGVANTPARSAGSGIAANQPAKKPTTSLFA